MGMRPITVNHIEGATADRSKFINYDIDFTKKYFVKKIPLNYYLPGYCQWTLLSISLFKGKKHYSTDIFSIKKKDNFDKSQLINFSCRSSHCKIKNRFAIQELKNDRSYLSKIKIFSEENL